jgi:hypothetical protein
MLPAVMQAPLTILFGSQTGNAQVHVDADDAFWVADVWNVRPVDQAHLHK